MPLRVCVQLPKCVAQCEQGVRGHNPKSQADNQTGGALNPAVMTGQDGVSTAHCVRPNPASSQLGSDGQL